MGLRHPLLPWVLLGVTFTSAFGKEDRIQAVTETTL